jgi:hypothetical protein
VAYGCALAATTPPGNAGGSPHVYSLPPPLRGRGVVNYYPGGCWGVVGVVRLKTLQ